MVIWKLRIHNFQINLIQKNNSETIDLSVGYL